MNLKSVILVSFFSLAPSFSQAGSEANCTDVLKRIYTHQYHRFWNGTACWLSVSPNNAYEELRYRSVLLGDDGLMMVFNSFGKGNSSSDTGARTFYLFPRGKTPSAADYPDRVEIQTSHPSLRLIMDTQKGMFFNSTLGPIKEEAKVYPGNNGGIEIAGIKAVYLDGGFQVGADPTANPTRKSTFFDGQGNQCQVTNKEVFEYDQDGDNTFKFDDIELKKFLKNRCPRLQISW